MPIISKPREIRIGLDPDQGFPVSVACESIRYVEEDGVKIADLPVHVDSAAPDSPQIKAVLGEALASATSILLLYQAEVQRLATELAASNERIKELESRNG